MGKRILSHFLIFVATSVFMGTLFMWTIDQRVLNTETVNAELREAGVMQELANITPDIFTADGEDENSGEEDLSIVERSAAEQAGISVEEAERLKQELDPATRQEVEQVVEENGLSDEEIEQAIRDVVSVEYVDEKLTATTTGIITFIREGEPQPVIDLSDFPERVRSSFSQEIPDTSELDEMFADPIQVNEEGQLDPINESYSVLSTLKYVGILVFGSILFLEWLVTERGKKLRRFSRVFFYSGLSVLLLWGVIVMIPNILSGPISSVSVNEQVDATPLVESIVSAV